MGKNERYCTVCGTKMIETLKFTGRFDNKTGKGVYHKYFTCPGWDPMKFRFHDKFRVEENFMEVNFPDNFDEQGNLLY